MSEFSTFSPNPGPSAIPHLIAVSDEMNRVLELARRAARSDATVLIQGDTGTGKEVVARFIHEQSPRSRGPFVPVNCGAYSDSLLASELFGHVRGSFTGAVADRAGVFEAASGGTVFLDEIGATSPAMQVKLLRVLQEQRVMRVGASRETPVDARVIAATNAELSELVRSRQFREDLYYRIKVVSCRIPPLRERRADIQPLVDHFLGRFARESAKTGIRLASETLRVLREHDWPGNVRQLRAEIEQVVAMADDDGFVTPDQLSDELRGVSGLGAVAEREPMTHQEPAPAPIRDAPMETREGTYQELLDEWTQKLVAHRLEKFAGNITKTAQSLSISRSTLYALLKKYGMQGQDD